MDSNSNILDCFEEQIDALLQKYERYKQENKLLRDKHATLINENNALREKNSSAVGKIEAIVQKLKLIENGNVDSGS
jgi:uncharacterized protein (TIGR02449 family)